MQYRLLTRTILLFLVTTYFALALQSSDNTGQSNHDKNDKAHQRDIDVVLRTRRAVKKPGFFRTLFSVIYEQWNDTKNTFGTVNNLINDNFLPDNAPVTTAAPITDPNVTTTEAPYRISRSEFNKILRKNVKGLQRLFDIELKDALKQSKNTYAEFQKNKSIEVSKYL